MVPRDPGGIRRNKREDDAAGVDDHVFSPLSSSLPPQPTPTHSSMYHTILIIVPLFTVFDFYLHSLQYVSQSLSRHPLAQLLNNEREGA